MTQALIKPRNIKDLVQQDAVKDRLREIMGQRAPQFAAALVQIVNQSYGLSKCDPNSIMGCAMTSAALDLSVDPNLAEAYLVPYGDKCQLQIGYIGFAQLAMRSGQYKNLGWKVVYEGELTHYDELSGELELDATLKKSDKVIGYASKFKLLNGFERGEFWTAEEIEAHADRYSKAYRYAKNDKKKQETDPWFTQRDTMGLKTVLKSLLRVWGPKSIQMQKAIKLDGGAVVDVESEQVEYVDNAERTDLKQPQFDSAGTPETKPQEAVKEVKEAAPVKEKAAPKPSPESANPSFNKAKAVRLKLDAAKVSEAHLIDFLFNIGFITENVAKLDELPPETLDMLYTQSDDVIARAKEEQS